MVAIHKRFSSTCLKNMSVRGPVPIPEGNPNLHHPQFFLGNSAHAKHIRFNVQTFFADRSASGDGDKVQTFLHHLRREASSIYHPLNDHECLELDVAYYTLPSLVFELFEKFSLLDIYTFWCCEPLLARKAPHAWGSQLQRDAARLRKAETGRWGKE